MIIISSLLGRATTPNANGRFQIIGDKFHRHRNAVAQCPQCTHPAIPPHTTMTHRIVASADRGLQLTTRREREDGRRRSIADSDARQQSHQPLLPINRTQARQHQGWEEEEGQSIGAAWSGFFFAITRSKLRRGIDIDR